VQNTYVFRVDRSDGDPWVARVFPPRRARAAVEGDATILRFLAEHDFPAERLALDDAVSDFDGRATLVTQFVDGEHFPPRAERPVLGDLLGRLHALPLPAQGPVTRAGGATGEDPSREGSPAQELAAALALLDSVDTSVDESDRERFEALRERVRSADDGHGLPERLIHGNLLHSPHHVIVSDHGPVAINWRASGRGPRLVPDFADLVLGTPDDDLTETVHAYRRHVELTDDELDRLEAVMWTRPLYITCFAYHRNLTRGLTRNAFWWIEPPEMFGKVAAATRAAYRR
jgi:Ser/Thr protein kinase RdoA (MazF antagonist)